MANFTCFGQLISVKSDGSEGVQVPITQNEFFIGSDSSCYLRLHIPGVESLHCSFLVHPTSNGILRNLSKSNPVHVNGKPVLKSTLLQNDDLISILHKNFKWQQNNHPKLAKSSRKSVASMEQNSSQVSKRRRRKSEPALKLVAVVSPVQRSIDSPAKEETFNETIPFDDLRSPPCLTITESLSQNITVRRGGQYVASTSSSTRKSREGSPSNVFHRSILKNGRTSRANKSVTFSNSATNSPEINSKTWSVPRTPGNLKYIITEDSSAEDSLSIIDLSAQSSLTDSFLDTTEASEFLATPFKSSAYTSCPTDGSAFQSQISTASNLDENSTRNPLSPFDLNKQNKSLITGVNKSHSPFETPRNARSLISFETPANAKSLISFETPATAKSLISFETPVIAKSLISFETPAESKVVVNVSNSGNCFEKNSQTPRELDSAIRNKTAPVSANRTKGLLSSKTNTQLSTKSSTSSVTLAKTKSAAKDQTPRKSTQLIRLKKKPVPRTPLLNLGDVFKTPIKPNLRSSTTTPLKIPNSKTESQIPGKTPSKLPVRVGNRTPASRTPGFRSKSASKTISGNLKNGNSSGKTRGTYFPVSRKIGTKTKTMSSTTPLFKFATPAGFCPLVSVTNPDGITSIIQKSNSKSTDVSKSPKPETPAKMAYSTFTDPILDHFETSNQETPAKSVSPKQAGTFANNITRESEKTPDIPISPGVDTKIVFKTPSKSPFRTTRASAANNTSSMLNLNVTEELKTNAKSTGRKKRSTPTTPNGLDDEPSFQLELSDLGETPSKCRSRMMSSTPARNEATITSFTSSVRQSRTAKKSSEVVKSKTPLKFNLNDTENIQDSVAVSPNLSHSNISAIPTHDLSLSLIASTSKSSLTLDKVNRSETFSNNGVSFAQDSMNTSEISVKTPCKVRSNLSINLAETSASSGEASASNVLLKCEEPVSIAVCGESLQTPAKCINADLTSGLNIDLSSSISIVKSVSKTPAPLTRSGTFVMDRVNDETILPSNETIVSTSANKIESEDCKLAVSMSDMSSNIQTLLKTPGKLICCDSSVNNASLLPDLSLGEFVKTPAKTVVSERLETPVVVTNLNQIHSVDEAELVSEASDLNDTYFVSPSRDPMKTADSSVSFDIADSSTLHLTKIFKTPVKLVASNESETPDKAPNFKEASTQAQELSVLYSSNNGRLSKTPSKTPTQGQTLDKSLASPLHLGTVFKTPVAPTHSNESKTPAKVDSFKAELDFKESLQQYPDCNVKSQTPLKTPVKVTRNSSRLTPAKSVSARKSRPTIINSNETELDYEESFQQTVINDAKADTSARKSKRLTKIDSNETELDYEESLHQTVIHDAKTDISTRKSKRLTKIDSNETELDYEESFQQTVIHDAKADTSARKSKRLTKIDSNETELDFEESSQQTVIHDAIADISARKSKRLTKIDSNETELDYEESFQQTVAHDTKADMSIKTPLRAIRSTPLPTLPETVSAKKLETPIRFNLISDMCCHYELSPSSSDSDATGKTPKKSLIKLSRTPSVTTSSKSATRTKEEISADCGETQLNHEKLALPSSLTSGSEKILRQGSSLLFAVASPDSTSQLTNSSNKIKTPARGRCDTVTKENFDPAPSSNKEKTVTKTRRKQMSITPKATEAVSFGPATAKEVLISPRGEFSDSFSISPLSTSPPKSLSKSARKVHNLPLAERNPCSLSDLSVLISAKNIHPEALAACGGSSEKKGFMTNAVSPMLLDKLFEESRRRSLAKSPSTYTKAASDNIAPFLESVGAWACSANSDLSVLSSDCTMYDFNAVKTPNVPKDFFVSPLGGSDESSEPSPKKKISTGTVNKSLKKKRSTGSRSERNSFTIPKKRPSTAKVTKRKLRFHPEVDIFQDGLKESLSDPGNSSEKEEASTSVRVRKSSRLSKAASESSNRMMVVDTSNVPKKKAKLSVSALIDAPEDHHVQRRSRRVLSKVESNESVENKLPSGKKRKSMQGQNKANNDKCQKTRLSLERDEGGSSDQMALPVNLKSKISTKIPAVQKRKKPAIDITEDEPLPNPKKTRSRPIPKDLSKLSSPKIVKKSTEQDLVLPNRSRSQSKIAPKTLKKLGKNEATHVAIEEVTVLTNTRKTRSRMSKIKKLSLEKVVKESSAIEKKTKLKATAKTSRKSRTTSANEDVEVIFETPSKKKTRSSGIPKKATEKISAVTAGKQTRSKLSKNLNCETVLDASEIGPSTSTGRRITARKGKENASITSTRKNAVLQAVQEEAIQSPIRKRTRSQAKGGASIISKNSPKKKTQENSQSKLAAKTSGTSTRRKSVSKETPVYPTRRLTRSRK